LAVVRVAVAAGVVAAHAVRAEAARALVGRGARGAERILTDADARRIRRIDQAVLRGGALRIVARAAAGRAARRVLTLRSAGTIDNGGSRARLAGAVADLRQSALGGRRIAAARPRALVIVRRLPDSIRTRGAHAVAHVGSIADLRGGRAAGRARVACRMRTRA